MRVARVVGPLVCRALSGSCCARCAPASLRCAAALAVCGLVCRFRDLPAGCVCSALPAALQNPQKKKPLVFWSMYLQCAPMLRPADILSTAVSDCAAALDVGIASPDAAHADTDCTDSMSRAKKSKYAPYEAELARQNIQYRPIIFSAYGRPHPDAQKFLGALSRAGEKAVLSKCCSHPQTARDQPQSPTARQHWM